MKWLSTKRKSYVFHGAVFYADPQWKDTLESVGLSANSDWPTLRSDQSISQSYNTTSSYKFDLSNGQHVYFKRYVYRKFRLTHWLQPSKAAVEAAGLEELRQLGIATPQTLAYGELRIFGILRATFIVTLGIPNAIQLDRFLLDEWRHMPHDRKREWLLSLQPMLLKQLTTAHSAGFYHHDLKLRNILLQRTNTGHQLIWIDCPRSQNLRPQEFKAASQDFSAMARIGVHVLTRGQRMRLLLTYCRNNRQHARQYWHAISEDLAKRPPRPAWHLLPKRERAQYQNKNDTTL